MISVWSSEASMEFTTTKLIKKVGVRVGERSKHQNHADPFILFLARQGMLHLIKGVHHSSLDPTQY